MIKALDPVWALTPRGTMLADEIINFLRWKVEGAHFSPSYRRYDKRLQRYVGHWDGYMGLTRLTKHDVVFPAGLVPLVVEQPWARGRLTRHDPEPVYGDRYSDQPADLTDLQESIVASALNHTRGILQAPTGFGKGRVIGEVIRRLGHRTLVLCDKTDMLDAASLAGQIEGVIGERVGRIGGGTWKEADVTVATYQTLARHLDADILTDTQVVIVDEVQHAVAKSYQDILSACTAPHRYGLSAKPFKEWDGSADKEAFLKVQAFLGPFLGQVSMAEAVEAGRIVPVDIFIVHDCDWSGSAINYREEYDKGIVQNWKRNAAIVDIANRFVKAGEPTAILVQALEHGEILSYALGWPFLSGSVETGDRATNYNAFRNGDINGLVISKIGDEALDLPNAKVGILAGGGNATARQTQRIGRFMRSFAGKDGAFVFDFEDYGRYISKHYNRRRRGYETESAYTVTDITLEEVL